MRIELPSTHQDILNFDILLAFREHPHSNRNQVRSLYSSLKEHDENTINSRIKNLCGKGYLQRCTHETEKDKKYPSYDLTETGYFCLSRFEDKDNWVPTLLLDPYVNDQKDPKTIEGVLNPKPDPYVAIISTEGTVLAGVIGISGVKYQLKTGSIAGADLLR